MGTIININQASLIVFSILLAAYIISITILSCISTPAGKQSYEKNVVTSLVKMFVLTLGFTGLAILADLCAYDGKTPENIIALILNISAAISAAFFLKYICKFCSYNLFDNARRLQEADKDEAYKVAILQRIDECIDIYKNNNSIKDCGQKAVQETQKQ